MLPKQIDDANDKIYLTYMQNTSLETLGRKKHKLESRLSGEISVTSDITEIWTGRPGMLQFMGSQRVGHH